MRRPKTELTEEEKELIDEAVKESCLTRAVHLRLYIEKHYKRKLPYNKIHRHLLRKGFSKEDKEKKKQIKYCRYERDHSFSLVHLDWHVSKVVEGKQVCVVFDDASRNIICGGEFDEAIGDHAIALMKQAIGIAYDKYSSIIREANTDKVSQFYCNKNDSQVIVEKQSLNNSWSFKELITFHRGEIIHKRMVRMKDGSGLMRRTGEDIKHLRSLLIGIMIRFIWG